MNTQSSPEMDAAVDFLKRALPLADRISLSDDALRRVASHALRVRKSVPWGASIPDDIFLPFVLFPRVNNEDPVFYHGEIWARLEDRIAGLNMADAVQAVNRWCFEGATYQSTDGRTANALTVLRRGFARCGEESVLLVSALRACGIPARQVYVPLWSHCDDNHAWVEAWVDGTWRYLGACEPELSLDSGWFTAAASKAMLVHTRAYGLLPAGERAETQNGISWEINRLSSYAETRLLTVRVTDHGAPAAGVRVDFEVVNMGGYRPICSKRTDAAGAAELLTGRGTLHVWISDGQRHAERTVNVVECDFAAVDLAEAECLAAGTRGYHQLPPRESRIQPSRFSEEDAERHDRWMAETEKARQARFAVPETEDALMAGARGNRAVIAAFLGPADEGQKDRRALLESLRQKDLVDATADMLEDALRNALPYRDGYPYEVWKESVLCPRVRNEMLRPVRAWISRALPAMDDADAVWDYLQGLKTCEMEPPTLLPDLKAALTHGACSATLRDVLFVAVCRAKGIAARLDPVTGEKMVWKDGRYRALLPSRSLEARLVLNNASGRALNAGVHFSVAVLDGDAFRPLDLYGRAVGDRLEIAVYPGCYRVMTASRQIDGGIDGYVEYVRVAKGETAEVVLRLPDDDTASKLIRAKLPPLRVLCGETEQEYPEALRGKPGVVAVIHPGQEPTEHLLNELLEARDAVNERGLAVRLIVRKATEGENAKARQVLAALDDAKIAVLRDEEALLQWRVRMNAGELRLPLAVAVGRSGEGLFAFVNYNVGTVMTLLKILDSE